MVKNNRKVHQVGVMCSSSLQVPSELLKRAKIIGEEIAKHGCVLITGGGTTGVALFVAKGAKSRGGKVIAISPGVSPEKTRSNFKGNKELFDAIIQTGLSSSPISKKSIGLDYLNITSSDALIFIGGGIGTLAEFIIAAKAGKVIGILDGSGGVTEFFDKVVPQKESIIYCSNPQILVRKVLFMQKGQLVNAFPNKVKQRP